MKYAIKQYDGDESGLSSEMLLVAEILSEPGRRGMTIQEIADLVQTSPRTINRWRRDPAVMDYIRRRSLENVTAAMPDIMETLVDKARSGSSIKSIEIYARIAGLLTPEMIVKPVQPEKDRSNAAIEAEIERLRAELQDMGVNINDEEDNQ